MKTFRQVRDFNQAVNSFTQRNPDNANTKLGYAIKKISEVQIKNIVQGYQKEYTELYYENVERIQVDQALTNPATQAVLTAERGSDRPFLYSKEGLLVVMKAEKGFGAVAEELLAKWDLKEFDITPHVAVEVPEDLLANEKEAFSGFVITEEQAAA